MRHPLGTAVKHLFPAFDEVLAAGRKPSGPSSFLKHRRARALPLEKRDGVSGTARAVRSRFVNTLTDRRARALPLEERDGVSGTARAVRSPFVNTLTDRRARALPLTIDARIVVAGERQRFQHPGGMSIVLLTSFSPYRIVGTTRERQPLLRPARQRRATSKLGVAPAHPKIRSPTGRQPQRG
ncbi:hypothetical protein TBK1r_17780 [Stieleria magnilauensis]|uniref:Uncharacterized protein n=1 Tax=Stieleria magnilauensis TaxID=2527963 RepID=A0ABX5XQF0_9BACT|nr:hypothetical protein TBK1r_17780 [Planctomycetes bacterium TBK1r]